MDYLKDSMLEAGNWRLGDAWKGMLEDYYTISF